MRLLTGSSRLAVLASQTAVIANGSGGSSSRAASARTTGVSSTAVVSRLSRIVVIAPIAADHDEQPRDASAGGPRHPISGLLEDLCALGQLRQNRYGDEESEHRADASGHVAGVFQRKQAGDDRQKSGDPGGRPHSC